MIAEIINVSVDLDVYKAIEGKRVSFTQSQNDILRECLGLCSRSSISLSALDRQGDPLSRSTRRRVTGSYGFVLSGKDFHFSSLKDAYLGCLKLLSKRDSNFLAALSKMKSSARRIISDEPSKLYLKSPHLAEKYAERLVGDWWVDVNLSQSQVESRLEQACECTGLKFGSDLKLDFPEE